MPSTSRPAQASGWSWLALTLLLPLLPFAPGLLAGRALYFRDLGRYFFPWRLFVLEGLRQGQWRAWNPYVSEGVQELFAPLAYPLDLLQLLWPDERWLTLLLVLHLPLAAGGAWLLARTLGLRPEAAALSGISYTLGGFALSTVNLYDYVLALAWAPFVVWSVRRAGEGLSAGRLAAAAGCLACSITTGRIEIVGQSLLLALVLMPWRRSRTGWVALAIALGLLLAAPTWLTMGGALPDSSRAQGLSIETILLESIHPLTWLQLVISNLYGDLSQLVSRFWGERLFARGFPYFLSLYLGPITLTLAALGLRHAEAGRRRVLALLLLAVWVGLGTWGGWGPILEQLPTALRKLRYPAKAFFSVHFLASLLAGVGLDAVLRLGTATWSRLSRQSAWLTALLILPPAALACAPQVVASSLAAWLPAAMPVGPRLEALATLARSASWAAAACAALSALAGLVAGGWLRARPVAGLLVLLCAADLYRAGAALNPMVALQELRPSEEVLGEAQRLRQEGGRLFVCDPLSSASYPLGAWRHEGDLARWSHGFQVDALVPYANLPLHIPVAPAGDLTGLVPVDAALAYGEADCAGLPGLLPRLRRAGVRHVLMADLVRLPGLHPVTRVVTNHTLPLALYFYRLDGALPLAELAREVEVAPGRESARQIAATPGFDERGAVVVEKGEGEVPGGIEPGMGQFLIRVDVPGHLEADVTADAPALLLVRQNHARGWTAHVAGRARPLWRANGRHLAVAVPAGKSRVVLDYTPPGARLMAALPVLGLLLLGGLAWAARRKAPAQSTPDDSRCAQIPSK